MFDNSRDDSYMSSVDNENRILSKASADKVLDEIISYIGKQGSVKVKVSSWWGGGQRWARNVPSMTSDQREITVKIERFINGGEGESMTNQLDSVSLRGAADLAEKYAVLNAKKTPLDPQMDAAKWSYEGSNVWSDATYNRAIIDNAKVVADVTRKSIEDNLFSAGFIGSTGSSALEYSRDAWGREAKDWGNVTAAQCSITVRHPKGLGSGWAGKSSFDIGRWKIEDVAEQTYEKCKLSLNPVRIEPGRYTSILEPQAVSTLTGFLVDSLGRLGSESANPLRPMYYEHNSDVNRHISKLGLKIADSRLNIYHDPKDPLVGTHSSSGIRRVDLIKNGVLTEMYNSIAHEVVELHSDKPSIERSSYKVDGENVSVEDMINTTRRGLLVSRLEQAIVVDQRSIQLTGVTRDGLWLIESGKITKAVKNFRWTESPLFAFNNIEDLGVPEPVFKPLWGRAPLFNGFQNSLTNVIVPSMKIKDFHFSSTIDAI